VPRLGAEPRQRALGTTDLDTAKRICAFLRLMRDRREGYLLDAIADGRAPIGAAYDAYMEVRLDTYIKELREGKTDIDVEPFVAKWVHEMERVRRPNADSRRKYEMQVRKFVGKDKPFPRSTFTRKAVRDWLAGLSVGAPNRYRAALSSFARFLVVEDILPTNVVRDVPMVKEREPRLRYLSQAEAVKLVDALPEPYRALHALMLATAMEVGAALKVRRGDLDFTANTAFARGTKRRHRTRTCTVYHRWLWAWEIVRAHVKRSGVVGEGPLFPSCTSPGALEALRDALPTVGLSDYLTRDHRHTWAVQAIRDGIALHAVSHQLGHINATMVLSVYGRFVPTAADFSPSATSSATVNQKEATK
jgi:integrase